MSSGETTESASDRSSSRSQTINWPRSTIGYSGESEKLAGIDVEYDDGARLRPVLGDRRLQLGERQILDSGIQGQRVELLRFAVLPHGTVQRTEFVARRRDLRVIRTKKLLADGESVLQPLLRSRETALRGVVTRPANHGFGNGGMIGFERFLLRLPNSVIQWTGFRESALLAVHLRKPQNHVRRIRMLRTQRFLAKVEGALQHV